MDALGCSKRIFEVAELLNLQDKDICSVTGLSKSAMSKIRSGKQQVPMAMIVDFAEKFPRVNLDYIVRAKGPKVLMKPDDLVLFRELRDMERDGIDLTTYLEGSNLDDYMKDRDSIDEDTKSRLYARFGRLAKIVEAASSEEQLNALGCISSITPAMEANTILVPFIQSEATASFIDSLEGNTADYVLEETPVVPRKKENLGNGLHFVFATKGNSMSPTIMDGAKILAERVNEGEWEYVDGVVVVVYGKSLVVKRIQHNDLFTNNYIELSSDNQKYGSIKVQRCDIRGIFKVKRKIDEDVM